ncbi:MAG: hypothetical protein MUC58_02965 [Rhizobiaceae bacterium]|nr:hypothetical protein [Rhizobiaceae bacterium]
MAKTAIERLTLLIGDPSMLRFLPATACLIPAVIVLAACTQSAPPPAATAPTASSPPVATGIAAPGTETPSADPLSATTPALAGQTMTPPNADEAACLGAVRSASGQQRVVIISSDFAEGATSIVIGAGLPLVNWRCAVSGGVVSGVAPEPTVPQG